MANIRSSLPYPTTRSRVPGPSLVVAPTKGASRASARRPLQSVDTNLSSYDRTDPFAAFNVLRKVLASLSTRVGSCQYKLTQEEHKLSMHLLTIVEPFIGLSPSRRSLTRQPTEILDAIVFYVDSKRDLLSLALSCRRFHGIIFPRHFDYRIIRCKVSSISVWNHLVVQRALARNVRRLEILDERSTDAFIVPPSVIFSDTDLESSDDELGMHDKQERFLACALIKMTALSEFIWSCNHSPIAIDNIWPTLLKCRSLKAVEINDNLVFSPREANSSRTGTLPELTSVALCSTKHIYGCVKSPDLTRVTDMLHHCPNLENLNIGYDHRRGSFNPKADHFLICSRWPNLRSLALTNLWCSASGYDAAASFLCAHLNLEVLHLDLGRGGSQLMLPHNALPRLQELKCNKDIANAILSCTSDTPRPLETIKGVRLAGHAWDQAFLENLEKYDIKRLELIGFNETEDVKRLVEYVPRLTWLDLGRRASGNPLNKSNQMTIPSVTEWAVLLAQLPDLTTFHGVRFFYEVIDGPSVSISDKSRVKKNKEIASVLAWKCPKLRRLDHWEDNSGKVIVLLRDEEEVRYEVRRVKL